MVRLGSIGMGAYSSTSGGIGDEALRMLQALYKVTISSRAQTIFGFDALGLSATAAVDKILEQFKNLTDVCTEILNAAANVKPKVSQLSTSVLHPDIEEVLQQSPVGQLLPLVASSLKLLAETNGELFFRPDFELVTRSVSSCLASLQKILPLIPKEKVFIQEKKNVLTFEYKFDSLHPYLPNTDEYTPVSYPGAKKITITFSEKSRMEQGYDYLRFYKDSNHRDTWHPEGLEGMYTGNKHLSWLVYFVMI